MIWSRLKDMLCPGCRSPIAWKALEGLYRCENLKGKCQFGMSEEAFNRVVSGLYTPKQRAQHMPSEEENMSALNNFGHTVRSEDYSDRL